MKKFYFVAVFVILATLCGCSAAVEENQVAVEVAQSEFTIGLPVEVSRTSVDAEGRASWVEGDTFALWAEDAAGTPKFDGVKFTMLYYWHSYQSAVFTAKADSIAEGEYTYYAVAPMPENVTNGKAAYTIPAQQQGDVFNGAYDIMVAKPTVANALSSEGFNSLSLDFQHKMHTFRVNIVENNLGIEVGKLVFSFPTAVTGSVAVDLKDVDAAATLSNGSKDLVINCADGAVKGDVIWGIIFPQTISGNVVCTAYGVDGRQSLTKNIAISKECLPGHITPLALTVPNPLSTLRFTIGENNLGEKIEKITITDHNGTNLPLTKLSDTVYDYISDSDSATVFDGYKGKTFTATFESANAVVSTTFTMPTTLSVGVNTIPALTVPYLLFEDFSCIHTAGESYGDNKVASSERNQPGVSLDSYMDHKGWNAARFMLGVGACPRINVRYQMVKIIMAFQSSHHGRLDTPQLTALKSGAKVKLRVQFDAGGVEYKGDFSGQEIIGIALATHTNAANPIDGIPTGATGITSKYDTTLEDYGTTHFLQMMSSQYTTSSFGSTFPTLDATVYDATPQTRLCFYPITTLQIDGVGNDECAVYIDNIRVSIISE